MVLYISVSSVNDWLTCKRLYYFKRIKKYEKLEYSMPLLVGRVIHEGLAATLAKKKDPVGIMRATYIEERKKAIETFGLTPEKIEDLDMQEHITKGMLLAYQKKYSKMIKDMKSVGSEVEEAVDLGLEEETIVVFKMDNLVRIRNRKLLHEFKTAREITPSYVKRVQTDLQTAVYYYFHNLLWPEDPIHEVMYDIVRKPSIRLKKKESKPEFVQRLQEWYARPEDMSVFHIERFKEPGISQDDMVNTLTQVAKEMRRCTEKEDYYQDFDKCHSYFGDICPMYELCHKGGETKENLLLYTIRKPYHINKGTAK